MKTIQKILMFCFLSAVCILQAQDDQRKGWDGVVKGGSFSIGYNNTMPNSAAKDAYVLNSSGLSADVFLPFSLFRKGWDGTVKGGTFGFNIGGTFNFGANGDPDVQLPSALNIIGQTSSAVAYQKSSSQQTGFRVGGGPQVNFNFSERFVFSPMILAEYFSMTQNELKVIQSSDLKGILKEYNLLTLPETKTSGLAITPKVRLQYFISKSLGIFADGAYVFGPKINTRVTTLIPLGKANQEGQYEQQQIDLGTKVTGEIVKTSYNAFSASVGLSYSFGGNHGSGETPTPAKADINKSRSNIKQQISTKPTDSSDDPEKPESTKADINKSRSNIKQQVAASNYDETEQNGKDIFTVTHIKKESKENISCAKIISPGNGSNQNVKESIKLQISSADQSKEENLNIQIYKISNDQAFFNKKENSKELFNTFSTSLLSDSFEKETKETGFKPISLVAKRSGSTLESIIEKGKLTEGAYKMVYVNNCGVTMSNFLVSSSALKTISLTTICKEKFGDYTYTFKVQNVGLNPINITSIPAFTSPTGTISGFTISPLPNLILPAGAIQTFTGNFTYSGTYTGDLYASVSGNQVGNPNLISMDTEMGEIKSCICNFCDQNADFDSDRTPNATFSVADNALLIQQNWWDMNPATASTIIAAKAEIISFSREVSDECMKCDRDSNQWGNFLGGRAGNSLGSFGNATGSVTGNTHHTLYFANPDRYSFNIAISLPPLSTLKCCCEKIKIKIRYTYTYRDRNGVCKMCSQVFEYSYQRGECPIIRNPRLPHINPADAILN